jgi:hypothetical protein
LTGQSIQLEGSEPRADRQQSVFVLGVPSIAVFALATNAFAFVVFGIISLTVIMSLVFLASRAEGDSAYDQIGRGGLVRDGEYESAAAAPPASYESPAAAAEREHEIRQLLSARSERLVRSGKPALDIDAELTRLLADEPAQPAPDDALVEEVRQLVVARNERRIRQGLAPLDMNAEVTRTLQELES